MKYEKSTWLVFAGLSFIVSFCAALWGRPLFLDGAQWFYNIIHANSFYFDPYVLRRLDLLAQLPAVLALNFFEPEVAVPLAGPLLSFCYQLHPYLSLIACWCIVRHFNAPQYFYYALLLFFGATQMSISFSVGVVPTTLSFYGPLFLLTLLQDDLHPKKSWPLLIYTVAFNFTYESAFLLMLPLLMIVCLRFRNTEQKKWLALLAFIQISVMSAMFLRGVITSPGVGRWRFKQHLLIAIQYSYPYVSAIAIGAFLLQLRSKIFNQKSALWFSLIFLIVAYFFQSTFMDHRILTLSSMSRTLAIPTAFVLSMGFALWGRHLLALSALQRRPLLILTIGLGLFSLYHDGLATSVWKRDITKLDNYIENQGPGCSYLDHGEIMDHIGHSNLRPAYVEFISILRQNSHKIDRLVFARTFLKTLQDHIPHRNPCYAHMNGMFQTHGWLEATIYTESVNYDYSPLMKIVESYGDAAYWSHHE